MNLLARINIGLIVVLALFFEACEEPSAIGLELTGDPNRIGVYYQEIELNTSLINNDSLFTLSVVRLLAGETYNPDFGTLTATAYTQFGYGGIKPNIPDSAEYDSLVLDVRNDYAYGQGIVTDQRFTLHELFEDLYDTAAYFSFSSAEYDPVPIATADFLFPERKDTLLSFRIDDSFGQRLFESVKDTNVVDPEDVSTLLELFKGFAIVSDLGNNSVMGINVINDSTVLRLYYTYNDSTYNYPFSLRGVANFNQILTTRTGSPLQGIEDKYYQEFIPENEKAYIQSGANLVTKLDFGPLLEFFDTIDYATISQCIINITIDEPGFNELPPSSVLFYYANENNKRIRVGGGFLGIFAEGTTDLLRAVYDEATLKYTAPITIFTDNLIQGHSTDTTVLVYPPEFGITNTVNQFIVRPDKIVLEIYYSRVK
jgi:hypothetical protein